MRHSLLRLLLLSALSACSSPKAPGPTGPAAGPVADADGHTLALLDAVGDSAPLTAVVDPTRWGALHAAVTKRAAALGSLARLPLAKAASPLATAAALVGVPPPARLPGLDEGRPWVFALFEPPANGPVGATTALLPPLDGGFPGFRHRAALPATDAKALGKGVADLLASAGYTASGPVAGRADSALLKGEQGQWCALWPDGDRLYVEWLSHVALKPDGAQALAPSGPVGKPARGAALLAASLPAALALRFEARHLRATYTAHGHMQAVGALFSVGDDLALQLGQAAFGLLMKAELLMGDDGADLNAHALTVAAEGEGIRLVWTAEATATGQQALAAGAKAAAAPLTVKGQPLAQATTALGWAALLDQAQVPPPFAKVGTRARDLGYAFAECGVGCWWQVMLRSPFGSAAGALQALGTLPGGLRRSDLPSLLQVVVPGPGQVALAAEIGPVDAGMIRSALAEIRPLREAQLHVLPRGERKVVLLGVGVDPRTVFDLAPAPAVGLGVAQVALGKVAAAIPGAPAEVVRAAEALGTLAVRASLQPWGVQQVFELALGDAPVAPSPATQAQPVRRVEALRCPTCADAGPVPAAAQTCLQQVALGFGGLNALAHAAPAQRPALAEAMARELEPALACVEAAPAARPAATALRATLARMKAHAAKPPPPPEPAAPPVELATPVAPPEPEILMGPRDKAGIQRMIQRNNARAKFCYELGLKDDPTLEGKVVLALVIAPDGRVSSAEAKDPPPRMARVAACLVEQAKTIRFPAGDDETRVTYPFIFNTAR
ncbi:MAG: AgmX/PglI C-terminal domain-containing protein [Myxococcales bacterium]|nr:AgmX/PglI C-terminal domain-containing protein [Myxococcales bacterium]